VNYIFWRKVKAFGNRLCFYLCRIFPIKENLISVCTFEGKGGFGCNPKYLVEELHRQHPEYEFVWLVNRESWEKTFPDYIKKVNHSSVWARAYWLSRSKVWIDNYRKHYGTVKRKGQYYINVNHYTIGIKCTGLWRGQGFSEMAYLVSKSDSDMMDGLVIDSDWCDVVSPKGLVFDGPYLKTGAPRCDALYGDRSVYKKQLREKYGIPKDANVVLYAPTFREGAKNGVRSVYSQTWSLDFKRLLQNLEERFGGVWYICTRVHPQLAPTFEEYKDPKVSNRMFDASQADDMYEILAGVDAYITDYSSACFEAGFAEIPVFLYADDTKRYAHDRGALMWNLVSDPRDAIGNNKEITPQFDVKMPFSLAHNNEELEQDIRNFDDTAYRKRLRTFHKQVGLVFSGNASQQLTKRIADHMR